MNIVYSKASLKFLKKQDTVTNKRIISAIEDLPNGDVKNLRSREGYRLRIGDFRILFDKDDQTIWVKEIGNRGEIYRR